MKPTLPPYYPPYYAQLLIPNNINDLFMRSLSMRVARHRKPRQLAHFMEARLCEHDWRPSDIRMGSALYRCTKCKYGFRHSKEDWSHHCLASKLFTLTHVILRTRP